MIILLVGKPSSGKDTFAQYLVDKYGFIRLSFADKLKEEVSTNLNIPLNYFYDRDLKDTFIDTLGCIPCSLLIQYANKKRSVDPEYFIKKININNNKNYVISDCRFKNELHYYNNAISIWIERDNLKDIFDNGELNRNDCQYIVYNNISPFDGSNLIRQLKGYGLNRKIIL